MGRALAKQHTERLTESFTLFMLAYLYLSFIPRESSLALIQRLVSLHPGTKRLECMNPNQLSRRKIVEGIQYPFSVTSYGKNLYYTDWRRYVIC